MRRESSSRIIERGNRMGRFTEFFANASQGELHLKRPVPMPARPIERRPEAPHDIDGDPCGPHPQPGADEIQEP